MSLAVLMIELVHIARVGVAPQADEGIEAHLFQILMAAQVPIIAFFAITWFPRNPKQAIVILVLQVVVALLPLAIVHFLKW
jgi:hypothetical protein